MSEEDSSEIYKNKISRNPLIPILLALGLGLVFGYALGLIINNFNGNTQPDLEQQIIKQNQTINLLLNATGKQLQFDKSVSDWSKTVEQRINLLNQTQGKKWQKDNQKP